MDDRGIPRGAPYLEEPAAVDGYRRIFELVCKDAIAWRSIDERP
jgi:hypothetical protein